MSKTNYTVRILDTLLKGPKTNKQLTKICLRYGARLHELRKSGYLITTENLGKGKFRYSFAQSV